MKTVKNGTDYEFGLEGLIGESLPLYLQDVRDATRIIIDMVDVTYINSIGVKCWIQWTTRVPKKAPFILRRIPLVIVNMMSTVFGLMPQQAEVESFFAPFVCSSCGAEQTYLFKKGVDYNPTSSTHPRKFTLPKLKCEKCKAPAEPDFLIEKAFHFLK